MDRRRVFLKRPSYLVPLRLVDKTYFSAEGLIKGPMQHLSPTLREWYSLCSGAKFKYKIVLQYGHGQVFICSTTSA